MSRSSPRRRRSGKRKDLLRALATRHPDELWAVLVAAGASPTVRHRWACVGHLVNASVRAGGSGTRATSPTHLSALIDLAVQDEPYLEFSEDFIPNDPRDDVTVRLGDGVVRLFPGSTERPVADLDRALLVADAVDPYLRSSLGFGVRDFLDVALGYANHAIGIFEPYWPGRATEVGLGDEPILSDREVDAARRLIATGTPKELSATPAMRKALDWATTTALTLPYDASDPQSSFGRYLRVAAAGEPARWLPLAFIPEVVGAAVCELASIASIDSDTNRRFAQLAAAATRQALWRFSSTVYGTPDGRSGPVVSPENVVQWVASVDANHALVVQVIARLNLRHEHLPQKPAALTTVLDRPAQEPTRVTFPGGAVLGLASDTELIPLLVVASAGHVSAPSMRRLPGMSLDDVRWAASTATADTDLFAYCQDLVRDDMPRIFGYEAINTWETWRTNRKAVITDGLAPDGIFVAPHGGNAEWARSIGLSALERDLAALGLPALREFDGVDHSSDGPPLAFSWSSPDATAATLGGTTKPGPEHRRPMIHGWTISPGPIPVAVAISPNTWNPDHVRSLFDIGPAFTWGVLQIHDAWMANHPGTIDGYVLELTTTDEPGADISIVEVQRIGGVVHAVLRIAFDDFTQGAAADPTHGRVVMADAISALARAAGVNPEGSRAIHNAWCAERPSLIIEFKRGMTSRPHLQSPLPIDEAMSSDVERRIAQQLAQSKVVPRRYTGTAARDLERDVLAPAALTVLRDRLADYSMDDVITFGMQQIERSLAERQEQSDDILRAARHMNTHWDPVERMSELRRAHLNLRRTQEIAVEAALRFQPAGGRKLDDLCWQQILAAAEAYFHATMRSEAIHYGLNPSTIVISDSFRISTPAVDHIADTDGPTYFLDNAGLLAAQSRYQIDDADVDVPQTPEADGSVSPTDPALDAAMIAAFGASGIDIMAALFALSHWPLNDGDPDSVAVSQAEVIDFLTENLVIGDEPGGAKRIADTVALLTSTPSEFAHDEWRPWQTRTRLHRLALRPLVTRADGRVIVSPYACVAASMIFNGYLGQGQLPWTLPEPPPPVKSAMEGVRDRRNRSLEKQVAAAATAQGWTVVENVKETKPQRLGVPVLRSEIDAVAGRAGCPTLWLLEVKDPADVHITPEVRRSLDRFYDDSDGRGKCYAAKLQVKYEDLAPHAAAVAQALGLPARPDDSPYVIEPRFVTRYPSPAAYVGGEYRFLTLHDINSGALAAQ